MQVKDLMNSHVVTVAPEETAAVAARLLNRHNIGVLPVCGSNRIIYGIITDRDIVLRCIAAGADPCNVKVRDLMTRRIASVTPNDPVEQAIEVMRREQLHRLPVCQSGALVGILTIGDVLRSNLEEASEALCQIYSNFRTL